MSSILVLATVYTCLYGAGRVPDDNLKTSFVQENLDQARSKVGTASTTSFTKESWYRIRAVKSKTDKVTKYTVFFIRKLSFCQSLNFLTFPEIEAEIFFKFSYLLLILTS